jgi:hypothetical protein
VTLAADLKITGQRGRQRPTQDPAKRTHLKITGCVEGEDLYHLVDDLHTFYRFKITGMHHILPSHYSPSGILGCVALSRMEPETAETHAIVPLVATKLIGSIKAVPRK